MPHVLVPLAQGVEELEAVTIIDLLRRANIKVTVAGLNERLIVASRGVCLQADTTLDAVIDDDFDLIVLAGGLEGTNNLDADPRIHQLLQQQQQKNSYIAAICAAPTVLANAGVLKQKSATAYPNFLDKMDLPEVNYIADQAVVIDDKVITSRGPGTAMDFALTLIEILTDKQQRDNVEAGLVR